MRNRGQVLTVLSAVVYMAAGMQVTEAAEAGKVLVHLEDDSQFQVLYSRAKSTATGMVVFGLIGYGIEESSRSSDDKEREQQILPYISDSTCRSGFLDSMRSRFEEKNFFMILDEERDEDTGDVDYSLFIKIHSCGFKLTNSTSELLSSFYAVTYRVVAGDAELIEKSDVLLTGRMTAGWAEILANGDLAAEEFFAIRDKAGRRIANQLIYFKGM